MVFDFHSSWSLYWVSSVLQSARCSEVTDKYIKPMCEGDTQSVLVDVFWDAAGITFPFILVLIWFPSTYFISKDMSIPSTVAILIGVLLLQFLPGFWSWTGFVFIAAALGIGIFLPLHRLRQES